MVNAGVVDVVRTSGFSLPLLPCLLLLHCRSPPGCSSFRECLLRCGFLQEIRALVRTYPRTRASAKVYLLQKWPSAGHGPFVAWGGGWPALPSSAFSSRDLAVPSAVSHSFYSHFFTLSTGFCSFLSLFSQRHGQCSWWPQLCPGVHLLRCCLEPSLCGMGPLQPCWLQTPLMPCGSILKIA